MSLSSKVCVVFGGSGDIGGAICRKMVKEGATVIPVGRNKTRLKMRLSELKQLGNTEDEVFSVDIEDETAVKGLYSSVLKKYSRIDVVACTSGVYDNVPAEKMTTKAWEKVIRTNLTGNFVVCREAGKIMLKQGRGSIITIGSLGSYVALSGTCAYSASKAAVVSLTQSLASEWADRGVRVNCIVPGVIPTRLNEKALKKPGRVDNILRGIPMKRLGSADEIAGAAAFLAGDDSAYITGAALPVDGGFLSFSGY